MNRFRSFSFRAVAASCAVVALATPARAAGDVLARVRAHGVLHCAGIVRPGIAVPTRDGARWYGVAADACRAVAAAVLGDATRYTFRPFAGVADVGGSSDAPDDVVFASASEFVGSRARTSSLVLGPTIVHDAIALLVPSAGVADIAALAHKSVCVEPGTPSDRALTRYFAQHAIALHEHPFQEVDEMRQAYVGGGCDALAGPRTTLASVRADPNEGHPPDRFLVPAIADDPIFAATTGDARWARVIDWTFAVLVDAEEAGVAHPSADDALPGVPPAVGRELGLSAHWVRDALSAAGDYGSIYDRDLGAESQFKIPRGVNALTRDGGAIYGLRVE